MEQEGIFFYRVCREHNMKRQELKLKLKFSFQFLIKIGDVNDFLTVQEESGRPLFLHSMTVKKNNQLSEVPK
jgi:hypothetical protein